MIRRHGLNIGLAAALIVSLGVNWYVRRPAAQPNMELAQRMARDPGFDTFDPNANFSNGMTLRTPVAGTDSARLSAARLRPVGCRRRPRRKRARESLLVRRHGPRWRGVGSSTAGIASCVTQRTEKARGR